ncbi:MAG TPA: O-antigen ligase family protein [Verrucomicrobiae bacterium]|nr:O-antigen ligase family protein [Verrucomicrobiae bacterium]
MDREKIDGWCEKGILALVLGILVFGPLAFGAHAAAQFFVLQGLTIGVLGLWLARVWIAERPQFLWPPICGAVVAFMGYAIARYCTADIEYVARQELLRVLVYGFLFCAVVNNCHRQESTQVIALTLLFLGMCIAAYACFQFFTKSQRIWNFVETSYAGRGRGTFIYPNHLAGFLEMLFPIGICYVVMGRLGHVTKIFLGYAVVVMLAAIGVTLSRGGWLATSLELMLLCGLLLAQRDFRLHGFVMLALLVVGAAIVIPSVVVHTRIARTVQSGKPDDLRLALWQSAAEMWRDNLLWGVGPGHFDYRFSAYRPVVVQLRPDRVHNDYLNALVDYGIIGTAIVAVAWILLAWGILKTWRTVRGGRDDFSRKKSNKFALLIGASVGLVGILFHSLLDFNMQLPANAILAVTLMALLSSQWRFETERFWFRSGVILKIVASIILLAGIGYLGMTGWRGARETASLYRARRLGQPPQQFTYAMIKAYEEAYRIDPMNFETAHTLGECYRLKSWNGDDDYVVLAKKAMGWYQRGMKLDPYDQYNWLNYGMCLDWIGGADAGAKEDSNVYYKRAMDLDPNGFFTIANIGWHYSQTGDLAAARTWFWRSRQLNPSQTENKMTYEYLPILERRMEENAEMYKRP